MKEPACPDAPLFMFDRGNFDGRQLSGRLLIAARGKEVLVHPLSRSSIAFHVWEVVDCANLESIPFDTVDVVGGCAKPADCESIRLRPGYYYGSDFLQSVVDGEPRRCVEVVLRLDLPNQDPNPPIAELRIRADVEKGVRVIESKPCPPAHER